MAGAFDSGQGAGFDQRQCSPDVLNADFADLRQDQAGWAEELVGSDSWDATLADGLED
jgi:hypothetical protein